MKSISRSLCVSSVVNEAQKVKKLRRGMAVMSRWWVRRVRRVRGVINVEERGEMMRGWSGGMPRFRISKASETTSGGFVARMLIASPGEWDSGVSDVNDSNRVS